MRDNKEGTKLFRKSELPLERTALEGGGITVPEVFKKKPKVAFGAMV